VQSKPAQTSSFPLAYITSLIHIILALRLGLRGPSVAGRRPVTSF
jgi:hypothetical protein